MGAVRGSLALGVLAIGGALSWAGLSAERAEEARVPSPEAISAATTHLRAELREGDTVVVLPLWYEAPWPEIEPALPPAFPEASAAFARGERLDPLELFRFGRVWVLAAFGEAPALPTGLVDAPADLLLDFGDGVSLARFPLPALPVLRRLTEDLEHLQVDRYDRGGKHLPCPRRGAAFPCGLPGAPWADVRLEHRRVCHRDVSWLWSHAGPEGGRLELRWRDVPTEGVLVLRAGFTMLGVRRPAGSPTRVSVTVGGRRVDSFILEPHRYGLERRLIPLPTLGSLVDIEVTVTADDIGYRQLMLQADVLGTVPGAVERWVTHDGRTTPPNPGLN